MFHELILALNGFTGDVFQYDGESIQTRKDLQIPLMHPSELVIINGILEIASSYKKLHVFIEKKDSIGSKLSISALDGPSGMFVSSVCNGIREILDEYLEVVASLEMVILENAYTTINHIRVKLEPFRQLFNVLISLTFKIEAQLRSSAVIVEIVKADFDINIPLQDDLKKLIPWVNRTLYKQIINWVVFGTLFDFKQEFFIKQKSIDKPDAGNIRNVSKLESSRDHDKYMVDYSIVPSHFSVTLTERILFVGYAIGILGNSEKTKASVTAKQKEFYEKLNKLPLDSFRTEELDDAIEELATAVGKDLHHLIVSETDLQKHLGIVKDFYLTGRGELFHDFLLNLKGISFSKNSLNSDVRQAFALAAGRVQVQEEVLQRIQISVAQDANVKTIAMCIANMTLEMENEWPLHVLFTHESISKYNELFIFLLQVRRLQMDLNLLWVNTRKIFRFPVHKGPAELRNVMSYFIDHLQHYLQEDVLESQFAILADLIAKSDNFEQIRVAHVTFQSNILSQSFRTSKQLRHFVEEIIKVCNNFVTVMNNHCELCDLKKLPINEGISKEVLGFANDFKRHMDLLLNLLKGMASNAQSGQYLGQFLLRLDFNSYFSSMISGFNV